jgi:methionyl-tRNA synthetase
MLLAAGLELPKEIWAHGYVQWEGAKMSKTAGTAVSLGSAIDRYGADALRYYLLREVGFENDGNFTWERFDARYDADLANGYGNLASRVLAMIDRYTGALVPDDETVTPLDQDGKTAVEAYAAAMDRLSLQAAADAAWSLVSRANQYVQETAPWTLAKAGKTAELATVLAALARALSRITVLASPFMPAKTQSVWESLGFPGAITQATWQDAEAPTMAGKRVTKPQPLFPKPEPSPANAG